MKSSTCIGFHDIHISQCTVVMEEK